MRSSVEASGISGGGEPGNGVGVGVGMAGVIVGAWPPESGVLFTATFVGVGDAVGVDEGRGVNVAPGVAGTTGVEGTPPE